MSKRIRSKRFKSKKAKSKNAKSKRDYKKTMNRRRKNKIKKINRGGSGEEIGKGAKATVNLVAFKRPCFAKKILRADVSHDGFIEEYDVLDKMDHSNIVKVFRLDRQNMCFYLEFCNAGDLYHYIKNRQAQVNDDCMENSNDFARGTIMGGGYKTMNKDQMFYVIQGILSGLKHIHAKRYIHCDIKPENILLTYNSGEVHNHKFTPKIADFGFAESRGSGKTTQGTNGYIPVECLVRTGLSQDYWGCGMTILEFIMMIRSPSSTYREGISRNKDVFKIYSLLAWNGKYLGDDLDRTFSDYDERESFRDLLCIPSRIKLEEFNVKPDQGFIRSSDLDAELIYDHYVAIRERGFNALCGLYDAR